MSAKENFDAIPGIGSVCSTILRLLGVTVPEGIRKPNEVLDKYEKADRAVIYNPDAVAFWLYEKYKDLFEPCIECSDDAIEMQSVMPSVTPVCFASMYTGLEPKDHGIQKYEKPVLGVDTMFDYLIEAGKKVAIVSTAGDSISKIFLKRNMDYFIYPTKRKVNKKAKELIKEKSYDVLVIYNPDFDSTMHVFGPESKQAIRHLKMNIATYNEFANLIKKTCKDEKVFYGFCPDHGCHQIDKGRGSHGLDMEEDMKVIHFYGLS